MISFLSICCGILSIICGILDLILAEEEDFSFSASEKVLSLGLTCIPECKGYDRF